LAQRGVELFECDRGGDVTFHGPGQIVGYPIFDLRAYAHVGADATSTSSGQAPVRPGESQHELKIRPDVGADHGHAAPLRKHLGAVDFVRRLEEVLIRTCADSTTSAEAKLAAIGIHISHFVTSHGFALNVNIDLSYFNLIIPCGITTKPVTSMQQELSKPLDLNAVAESISRNFGKVFSSQILCIETLDALPGNTVGVPMRPPTELRQLHNEDDPTWA